MRHLDDAIRRLCGGAPQDFVRARTVMANAIVASILPDGAVSGPVRLKSNPIGFSAVSARRFPWWLMEGAMITALSSR